MAMALRAGRAGGTAVITASLPWLSCGERGAKAPPSPAPGVVANLLRHRDDALARAKVWRPPATPIAEADFLNDGPNPFTTADRIECRYLLKMTSGVTPKFH